MAYSTLWVIELGMIIPPIGVIGFLSHGLAPQIGIGTRYRWVTPFIIADLALLLLPTVIPGLSLWLPKGLGPQAARESIQLFPAGRGLAQI